jgi:sulfur-carrier protein adenylyltransferase/sulfurtransferase
MAGGDAMSRYARQIPVIGAAAQARLGAARVLVVGAGGLAAPLLQYLVGAGVGAIRLVDADVVDETNLHRQTLFRMADLAQAKAQVAARHLAGLNPDCAVEARGEALTPANVAALCDGVDLVLDCADSFAVSYTLSDHCKPLGLPLISASVTGMAGYVGGFCGTAPSLRAVFPDLPARAGSCAEVGVLGPMVGILGSLQAQMALAVLLGIAPSPLGQLITAEGLRIGGFRFDAALEPGWQPRFIAADQITAQDFTVDLRGVEEAALVRPHALRLPASAFGAGGPLPALGQRAVLCCRSGLRAFAAAEALHARWDGEITLVAIGEPN